MWEAGRAATWLCLGALTLAACNSFGSSKPSPGPESAVETTGPEWQGPLPSPERESAGTISGPGCGERFAPGQHEFEFPGEYGLRRYLLYAPSTYSGARAVPLVVSFHGSSNSPEEIDAYTGFAAIAEREGFLLVTPQGSSDFGESGWTVYGVYHESGEDDATFTVALLDHLESTYCVDTTRVYAMGFSNGAEMASQMACIAPERFAAASAVAGLIYQGCAGGPVPILTFHGTDDYNVPYEFTPPAVAEWAAHNRCEGQRSETLSAHVEWFSFDGCEGAPVEFYSISGAGHTWPGAAPGAGGAGAVTDEISANEVTWDFFSRFSR